MTLLATFFDQLQEFVVKFFDTSDFPARWHCGRWSDLHGWLYIAGDVLVWGAYFTIPLIIVRFATKRRGGAAFQKGYFLFAAFILACGATHLLDAAMFWSPMYRVGAVARLITAAVSWGTILYLRHILPTAFALRSPQELEGEIELRKGMEDQLRKRNRRLEQIARIQSHDVRGPVATILGLSQLLEILDADDPEREKVIAGISECARDLDTVIRRTVKEAEAADAPVAS